VDDDRLTHRAELERFEIFPKPFSGAELVEKVKEVLIWVREKQARMSQTRLEQPTATPVDEPSETAL
jgi:hypothetical protein